MDFLRDASLAAAGILCGLIWALILTRLLKTLLYQVSPTDTATFLFVSALLTLVGYSVNDTIVVFDRVRENLKIRRRDDLESILNDSINQTLSRTILTSGLTFLTVLALFLFGGEIINNFAFAMVIGILVGTYSSIAVASPLVLIYTKLRGRGNAAPLVAAKLPRTAKAR